MKKQPILPKAYKGGIPFSPWPKRRIGKGMNPFAVEKQKNLCHT